MLRLPTLITLLMLLAACGCSFDPENSRKTGTPAKKSPAAQNTEPFKADSVTDFPGLSAAKVANTGHYLQSYYTDGKIVIEAENYTDRRPSINHHQWEARTTFVDNPQLDNFDSADRSIAITPVDDTRYTNYERDAARVDYTILFNQPGTYYVWARGHASDNNVIAHFGLDGLAQDTATDLSGFPPTGRHNWINSEYGIGQPLTLQVASAGEHTLNVWMEAAGVTLDKILLTPDAAFVPKGFGPQQSVQGKLPEFPVATDSHIVSWNFNKDLTTDGALDAIGDRRLSCTSCPYAISSPENNAFRFDGSESLQLSAAESLNFPAEQGFSTEIIFRPATDCLTRQQIVGRSDGDKGRYWYLACENSRVVAVIGDTDSNQQLTLMSFAQVNDDNWHHVVLSLDAFYQEGRLYVDGKLNSKGNLNIQSDFTSQAPLVVGSGIPEGTRVNFRGDLDALAIHRRPLREDEIQRHAPLANRGLQRDLWGCDTAVRIMPLGDSITAGTNRSGDRHRGSYRLFLYEALQLYGYNVDFVGSYTSRLADERDPQHEGWPGIWPEQAAKLISDWMEMNPPDLILLHLGTNNPSVADMSDILDNIQKQDSSVPVVVGKIINRQTFDPATAEFNDNLGLLVKERIDAGERLFLVDHESALDYTEDMLDNLHANESGAEKMAFVWREKLVDILPRCRPSQPVLPHVPDLAATAADLFSYWIPVLGHPLGTFSLLNAPPGMRIHPSTGEIRWPAPLAGTSIFEVSVANDSGSSTRKYHVHTPSE